MNTFYKVITGKLVRNTEDPQLDSKEHLFNSGSPLEMRASAIEKVKACFDELLTDKKEEYQKIPTKDELNSPDFKNPEINFFEIRFINPEEEVTIYSTLKNTLATETELFDGLLKETLWYKTNGIDVQIYEFKKPFNGFVLQNDFDFIGARLKTLKQKGE